MGTRLRELFLLLACCACALALSVPANKTRKQDGDNFTDQYEYYDADDQEEVLYNEDKPCPRDCLCTVTQGYKIAKCNRLEVGTQKFGDDITDLVIENADPRFPIELDDFIFKKLGLHQVATVKIVNSTIGSVGPHAFHGLRELYAVNLSSNKLKHLHPETFANNKKLLLLTLANNPLKFPALGSSDYFLNVSSLQELDVSYCKIEYITANTFQNMPSLMYLNVAGNALSEMNPDTFKKLLDLEELDLSDNNIKSLPDDIFSENTELATLHIQRNPIDSVYGLSISDLLTLNAGQTHLKFIGPSMFNGMTYIANLNLSGNSIEKIHNQAFHKLVELNYLDLSYNDLDFISNILIKSNIELDIFKISNNPRLTHLPENGFECSAEQFNIYSFDASNCGLEEVYENSLSTFTALALINLSGNKIKELSPKVFSRSPKLVEINLSHNMLTTLDTKVFEQNHELSKLFLQGNPMKILSAEVFYHTPSLSYLDMSHTELTGLWKEDKNSPATLFRNLSYLNVSHCRITIIKQSELERFNKLSTLDIGNNPLACSREFEDLMTWLSKHNVTPSNNHKIIANMIKDGKDEDTTYTWEALSKKVCGTTLTHTVDTSVSDEEIWERIDEDAEGNFDLKNTLDDGKVADDTKTTDNSKLPEPKTDKLEKQLDQEENADDDIDDDEGDDDADGDDDDDDDADDEEDDDDASEDYGDDDLDNNVSLKAKLVGDDKANPKPLDDINKNKKSFDDDDDELDLKVKLIENPEKKIKSAKQNKRAQTTSSSTTAAPIEDKMKLDIRLLDGEDVYDELELKNEHIEVEERLEYIEDDGLSRYAYLWPILIALLGALVLLLIVGKVVMIVCSRRTQQMQYNSAIIAAMSQQGRTKKDCGLVYQQLSEDLTGPTTPKLTRYQPLATVAVNAENISYESSPFHHTNIVPQAV